MVSPIDIQFNLSAVNFVLRKLIPADQAAGFFDVESKVRAYSSAESLGLAPVTARKIIAAFGGEVRLVKEEGGRGCLDVVLPLSSAVPAAAPGMQG
jgi:hypothetical protein